MAPSDSVAEVLLFMFTENGFPDGAEADGLGVEEGVSGSFSLTSARF